MVRTISVFAVPGMPVNRQWPPTNIAIRIWSSTSCWPTITSRTCSQDAFAYRVETFDALVSSSCILDSIRQMKPSGSFP